jgi:hypothetical protein
MDMFAILGDNFYDQTGAATFWTSLGEQWPEKPLLMDYNRDWVSWRWWWWWLLIIIVFVIIIIAHELYYGNPYQSTTKTNSQPAFWRCSDEDEGAWNYISCGFRFAGKSPPFVDHFHIHLPIYGGFPSQPCLIPEGYNILHAQHRSIGNFTVCIWKPLQIWLDGFTHLTWWFSIANC